MTPEQEAKLQKVLKILLAVAVTLAFVQTWLLCFRGFLPFTIQPPHGWTWAETLVPAWLVFPILFVPLLLLWLKTLSLGPYKPAQPAAPAADAAKTDAKDGSPPRAPVTVDSRGVQTVSPPSTDPAPTLLTRMRRLLVPLILSLEWFLGLITFIILSSKFDTNTMTWGSILAPQIVACILTVALACLDIRHRKWWVFIGIKVMWFIQLCVFSAKDTGAGWTYGAAFSPIWILEIVGTVLLVVALVFARKRIVLTPLPLRVLMLATVAVTWFFQLLFFILLVLFLDNSGVMLTGAGAPLYLAGGWWMVLVWWAAIDYIKTGPPDDFGGRVSREVQSWIEGVRQATKRGAAPADVEAPPADPATSPSSAGKAAELAALQKESERLEDQLRQMEKADNPVGAQTVKHDLSIVRQKIYKLQHPNGSAESSDSDRPRRPPASVGKPDNRDSRAEREKNPPQEAEGRKTPKDRREEPKLTTPEDEDYYDGSYSSTTAPPLEDEPLYKLLKEEKVKLQRELFEFRKKFKDETGRDIATEEDRAPVEDQYQKYQEIKQAIKVLEEEWAKYDRGEPNQYKHICSVAAKAS